MIKNWLKTFSLILICNGAQAQTGSLQKLYPVNFSEVYINDNFWTPKMNKVADVTLRACIDYTENKTGRIRNFERAALHTKGKHEGVYYDDSDVYKALEAMAYSLRNHPDSVIEQKADEWIDKIAAAQLPDGYLNTYYTLTGLENRWTDMEKHEDYCAGHLIEAAIAYYNTTGKRKILDVAIKLADHIDSVFRLNDRHWVSGHQEIELALMKLYHLTSKDKYLQEAKWFLDQRGHGYGKGVIWDQWKDPKYCQDELPVKDQRDITGHAVRAMYLYTGTADVAAVTGDAGYMNAMNAVWEDVVYRNMYLTGGIGALAKNEGFGDDYDLPNDQAYCETCASVGMVFWNQRMNMLTGNAKYIDVLERSLYNGALDGLSLSGDRFFYGNPLASAGTQNRREWFGTACCPSNIARLVASLGNYIYSTGDKGVWVNLFIGSSTKVKVEGNTIGLKMRSGYPWKGDVSISVDPAKKKTFGMHLRIPGWLNQPVPGKLYQYAETKETKPVISVNGKAADYSINDGYAVINRTWRKGDVITIQFPMEVRQVISNPEVKQDKDRIALQYGPLVYCVEGKDNNDNAWNIIMPAQPRFESTFQPDLLGGVSTINFDANVVQVSADGKSVSTTIQKVTAIPYYSWNNRGASSMQVWLPTTVTNIKLNY
jgi:DUF1680 family protein